MAGSDQPLIVRTEFAAVNLIAAGYGRPDPRSGYSVPHLHSPKAAAEHHAGTIGAQAVAKNLVCCWQRIEQWPARCRVPNPSGAVCAHGEDAPVVGTKQGQQDMFFMGQWR